MVVAEIHPDGIATLRLDRPDRRNALSIAMRDAISDTLEDWASNDGVRVVVLTAAAGRRVEAAEAHRIGLVNAVVEADRLEDEAMATGRVIAEAPQPALEASKRYLVSNAGVSFDEALQSNTTASSTSSCSAATRFYEFHMNCHGG
ncbi:hypothetical protein CQY20_18405 [Mycolicibacterium agri]|uniref:Enoyl-CoA hydratase/isomerase domain-containing protein n=1 Tax=Mycolicibacterium agri TaxID=36811 RepID=A0A2A7MYH4_MYCAG|nr:enoyl-CoA hydratase/isomerase family protein [Mycolicibacterium agri]PEG36573.1 hypothetical protein CQY20_18405 [Mycolicibacterium agri]GFG52010.1 hypothetical protein MAGR_34510 [Mycolicibacterium agri]